MSERARPHGGATGDLLQRAAARGVSGSMVKAAVAIAVAVLAIVLVRWAPSLDGEALVIEGPGSAAAQAPAGDGGDGDDDGGSDAAASAAAADSSGKEAGTSRAEVCVHVVGAVACPGVYVLDEGSRVADAVELAGGLAADASASAVNLARVVADGEQIYVPTLAEVEAGAVAPPSGAGLGAATSPGGASSLVNINTATSDQLQELPGIGPATATAIIAHREENGPFVAKEDVQNVSGIGPGKYAKIESLICV